MTTKNKIRARPVLKKMLGQVSFGEMLQAQRMGLEYTQVLMADILGISKQDLCNIEKGRKLVSVERAISFAASLEMPQKIFAKYALQDQLYKAGMKGEVIINDVA